MTHSDGEFATVLSDWSS